MVGYISFHPPYLVNRLSLERILYRSKDLTLTLYRAWEGSPINEVYVREPLPGSVMLEISYQTLGVKISRILCDTAIV